jgi:hypothetical protein
MSKKTKGLKKIALLILMMVLVGGGIGSYVALQYLQPQQPSQPEKPSSTPELGVVKITAEVLFKEYLDNEVAADLKYKGRLLQVSGSIADIGRVPAGYGEYSNKAYIRLDKTVSGIGVLCFFKDESEIAKLNREQEVIVEGNCNGCPKTLMTSDVFLLDCSLVERTEFQLTGWKVVDWYGYGYVSQYEYTSVHNATLLINFKIRLWHHSPFAKS